MIYRNVPTSEMLFVTRTPCGDAEMLPSFFTFICLATLLTLVSLSALS